MNRNCYRLVFSTTAGMMVPLAEIARGRGKAASSSVLVGALIASVVLANVAQAEMPVASTGGAIPNFVTYGQASYQPLGNQAFINQVGNKSILNWQSFNISAGNTVQFRQVDSLATNNLVPGASFTSLNRIWDNNPSVIAGSITQGAGQKANVILVNTNGIAFMGGSQVNLNSFTASTLNITDSFILDTLLTTNGQPQFEKALDGSEARGFVKVFENAKISAGSQGRVMLIAPTVINKGKVEAPDGQVVIAAGTKVFLRTASAYGDDNVRGLLVEVDSPATLTDFTTANTNVKNGVLDNENIVLTDVANDKLGHATNLGELTSARGNVTMVGYAVNQLGIARATTSVVANGSVYLLAKDRTTIPSSIPEQSLPGSRAQRAGRVILGANSLTEVLPDVADATVALDGRDANDDPIKGLPKLSQVQILGQDIRMAGGAVINAPSGEVSMVAMDKPADASADSSNPFKQIGLTSSNARIHIADGARINVAGLENVQVSAARNSVEVELRGDELKDSPVNREGALRGEKVYVDIERALANGNAGKPTLIATDSLKSYQGRLERTVAERSTVGGTVSVKSQGEAILETGAVVDLSGGSVQYTAATVKTTLLATGGKLVDIADADAQTRYDGIATRYVVDYGRWNKKEVIDLGQSYRFDPGYTEGKNAGALEVIGMGTTVMQADVVGRTVAGALQRDTGQTPVGASLRLGSNAVPGDYKLNQQIVVSKAAASLPRSFEFGDVLPENLKTVMGFNPSSVGDGKIAQLEIFSNQVAEIRDALRMPQGGSVQITARSVNVAADVSAQGGDIAFNARANQASGSIPSGSVNVTVDPGVTLSARGEWINQLPSAGDGISSGARVDGGSIVLSAVNDVDVGSGAHVDVTGGGRIKSNGKITGGKGGAIVIEANVGSAASNLQTGGVKLAGELSAYGMAQGGSLKLSSGKIQIGGSLDTTQGALNLDSGFINRGGFSDISLTGRDGVDVANGVALAPALQTLELQPGYTQQASGVPIERFAKRVVLDPRVRKAVNLTLSADSATRGDVRIGEGTTISLDDKAKLAINAAHRVEIEGQIRSSGGDISVQLNRSTDLAFDPASTIWLGSQAVLDASGVARTYTDSRGLTQGNLLAGGKIALNAQIGYVVTEAGSKIDVSGASPVRLDVINETGGLGRTSGSDAGAVTIVTREGALLDGTLRAQAGGVSNRGGSFSLTLGDNATPSGSGHPTGPRVISLANVAATQAAGLLPGSAIPTAMNGQAKLGAAKLEVAGFDRIALKSRDTIRLENDLQLGANRTVALREVTLDTPKIETGGGEARLRADVLRLGNYDSGSQAALNTASAGSGTLKANARLLELAGNQTLTGMARTEFGGEEEIRLAGVSANGTLRPAGTLQSASDMLFQGGVIAPATYVEHVISAPGRSVEFSRNTDSPFQPLATLGSMKVEAGDIVQGGNLWAPFGQIDLKASGALVFKEGSLTSVAANPGSLTPFGRMVNGQDWVYAVGSKLFDQETLAGKSIRISGATVDMQSGAKVNLGGGGDLQAYEFTVGPGGSRDILASSILVNGKSVATNTYAILPSFKGGFAPGDVQETFDRPNGEAVYLSGVPGLADGVYTLLPPHYALLPGAFAVNLNAGVKDLLPGQSYSRQDGVRIAAGYVTDTRANAPKDANWQGFEVLTREQVRARSEFTLTSASQFFAASHERPQDAGLLSVATSGSGASALRLDAVYNLTAGQGGRGAQVDISARSLAVISGAPSGLDANAVVVNADTINSMGADSVLIGGTRSTSGGTTLIDVGADAVTIANNASHALKSGEVMLAAKNAVTLKSGSSINAQGSGGDSGHYEISGDGAFVRAASTTATFARTGTPARALGTLTGELGSSIVAADSIILDATMANAYKGSSTFSKNGQTIAGNLGVGATRINFGAAPASADGITYSQAELDGLNSLKGLTLTSYSTFDLYGDVNVGMLDANGKPTLQNLTLQGAGLAGLDNSGKTANLRAKNIALNNSAAVAFVPGAALGNGALAVLADTLTLGEGDKSVQGFSAVAITANELVGAGTGKTNVAAPVAINVARIRGEKGAGQTLTSTGALAVASRAADRALAQVTALGAKWALAGTSVDFNSRVELPSGQFKLNATAGDVNLGADARVDVAGRNVSFFDVTRPTWGGSAEFASDIGNVEILSGAKVDVSAAPGGDAGTLRASARSGMVVISDGTVQGQAPVDAQGRRGEGARVIVDTGTLASFSAFNNVLNSGGFGGERSLRVRGGDVSVATSDLVKAKKIEIAVDNGKLDVAGELDASGGDAGRIALFAKNNVDVLGSARLKAGASSANQNGGVVEIGTTSGSIDLATGSVIDVSGGSGGKLLLRAPRINGDTDVAIATMAGTITGARSVAVEAVKEYSLSTLTAADLVTINADNDTFSGNHVTIKGRLSQIDNLLSGVEVRSTGDLTLASDWNLANSKAGGEAGVLTLSAAGSLKLNSNLSDGFSAATPCATPTCSATSPVPAILRSDDSWSYRLVAGADHGAANPLSVIRNQSGGNITLAAGKLIRTGTGDIRLAAGGNIELKDNKAAIYTAGRSTGAVLSDPVDAQFSQGGGDVSLLALGDISSPKRSQQLYSNWLFRQGRLSGDGTTYDTQPAWWVRFDQFQQGLGALGGGDVTVTAGGRVENISASTPTQARMNSTTPNASALLRTGGGSVRAEAGSDLLGGQYYADNGEVIIRTGGKVDTGEKVGTGVSAKPLPTVLALGDAQAKVMAQGDLNIYAVLNPHLVIQSQSATSTSANITGLTDSKWTLFSTYGDNSGVTLESLTGSVKLHNATGSVATIASAYGAATSTLKFTANAKYSPALLSILPPNLSAAAFQGDVTMDGKIYLSPAPRADLTLLAANSINIPSTLIMSDAKPLPNSLTPGEIGVPGSASDQFFDAASTKPKLAHAVTPVHLGDPEPVRIYAVGGDVSGAANKLSLITPKFVQIRAGRDVLNLGVEVQQTAATDASVIEAGRDFRFDSSVARAPNARAWVSGPGRLEVTAGRNIDLGASAGIVSRGNLDNTALPDSGASIQVAAGVGAGGIDYVGTVHRLVAKLGAGSIDDTTLWLARWLTGNETLNEANALTAVQAVNVLDAESKRTRVRDMLYTAIRTTGRDSLKPDSIYAAEYVRGYAALELAFPGISDPNQDGAIKSYQGGVNLFASRIKTERGGNIEFMIPGGGLTVGLSNTPDTLTTVPKSGDDAGVLGVVVADKGAVKGFAREDILVNQSRILTVAGGDVLLWSSAGDIDAGKGKKTATAVPPPVVKVDADGNVTQELQGAATGSGIGALSSVGIKAGDVDLIAPKGTVNAGDAGIRAGNLNIAAAVVQGADNISVSGKSSGTPVADTSAVSATASGATTGGDDLSKTTAALSQSAADSAKNAQALKDSFKPSFVRVDVLGFGE